MSISGWAIGVQLQPDSPVLLVHCQDLEGCCPGCRTNNQPTDWPWGPVWRVDLRPAPLLPVCPVCFQCRLCLRLRMLQLTVGPVCIGPHHGLHPFSVNRFDAGPVRLASIAHALIDYRIAVLQDVAKPATWTARSRDDRWVGGL